VNKRLSEQEAFGLKKKRAVNKSRLFGNKNACCEQEALGLNKSRCCEQEAFV
jgi:hypothetical protein